LVGADPEEYPSYWRDKSLFPIRPSEGAKMSVVFESKTAIVTYLDSGHMLHTDRATGELFRSNSTWENYESAKSAYHDLTSSDWEPVRHSD
jgi:hypothetical protein